MTPARITRFSQIAPFTHPSGPAPTKRESRHRRHAMRRPLSLCEGSKKPGCFLTTTIGIPAGITGRFERFSRAEPAKERSTGLVGPYRQT